MDKHKIDIMLLQILHFLLGCYYLFFTVLMLREFISLFGPTSPVPALAIAALTGWTALGCGLANLRNSSPEKTRLLLLLVLCPLLPLSAIGGIIMSMAASTPVALPEALIRGLLLAVFAPMLFGFISGGIISLNSSLLPWKKFHQDELAIGLGVFVAGIIILLQVNQIINPQIYMAFWSVPLLIWAGAAMLFSKPQPGFRAFCPPVILFMAFLACVLAVKTAGIRRYYWEDVEPNWLLVHNIETPRERFSVLMDINRPLNTPPKTIYYRQGEVVWSSKRDTKTGVDTMIPALLQTTNSKPSILLIVPPFSGVYKRLLELSSKGRIDVMSPSGELFDIEMLRGHNEIRFMNGNFFFFEPYRFMKQRYMTKVTGYDLIIMLDPPKDQLYSSDDFFKAVRSILNPEGAFISTQAGSEAAAKLKKYFPKVLTLSRDENILAAGGNNITDDHKELEKRFEKVSGNSRLPSGVFSILFPKAVSGMTIEMPEASLKEIINEPETDGLFPKWFIRKHKKDAGLIGVFHRARNLLLLLPLSGAFYLVCRFLAGRKHNRLLQFESVENGIFCGGFLYIVMLVYQLDFGSLYREWALLTALFGGGMAGGIYLGSMSKFGRRLMQILGILLPIMLYLIWHDPELRSHWIFSAMSLLTGVSGGAMALDIDSRRTLLQANELYGFFFGGIALGVFLVTLLIFSGVPSYWSIFLVVAILLPRSIDRQLGA